MQAYHLVPVTRPVEPAPEQQEAVETYCPFALYDACQVGVKFVPILTDTGPYYRVTWAPYTRHVVCIGGENPLIQTIAHYVPICRVPIIERRYLRPTTHEYMLSTLSVQDSVR